MTYIDYLTCFIVGLLGAVIHALMKIKSIEEKAKIANVQFKAKDYLVDEINRVHKEIMCVLYVKFAFAFIGYTGNDIASRVFGAVNKRVNTIIDKKTSESDEANNVTEPTPHK